MNISPTFKKIKTEFFFARRLLKKGYGPRYWWPYAKIRFFWKYFMSAIPKYDYPADPDLELHSVFQKRDVWMLMWSFRSFLELSGLRPSLVLHDDGTCDQETEDLIKSKLPHSKILFRQQTAELIREMPNVPNIVKETRERGHFFINRPINILALSKAKKIILSDTDILYFKQPEEVINFASGKQNYEALAGQARDFAQKDNFDLMMDDYYTEKYSLRDNPAVLLDGGYTIFDREKLNFPQMVEFLEHTQRPITNYFIEMAYCSCMLAQLNFAFLPRDRYHIKGPVTDKTVLKHFTSPRRYEMFAYGFDLVENALKIKK